MNHAVFIQRCFDLAQRGKGLVAPNPMVGAVLVYEDKIIAKGWHENHGAPHAEVNCLANVAKEKQHLIEKSTLYVNLEPCSHYGKTPPCADLVIEKKIPRLVYANTDPNPMVAGKGLRKLQEAGVEVIGPILEREGNNLNKRFFTFHRKNRPYIILKWAQSKDGFFNKNNGKQNWITGKTAGILNHQWRYEEAAILVGQSTVKTDNPELTNRNFPGENHPQRLVIDFDAALDFSQYKLGQDQRPAWIFNRKFSKKSGALEWIALPEKDFLNALLQCLYERNIQSLIVEGGAFTLQKFLDENLWDEARIFTGAMDFEKGLKAPALSAKAHEQIPLEEDSLAIYYRL